jgi:hypothetical protein
MEAAGQLVHKKRPILVEVLLRSVAFVFGPYLGRDPARSEHTAVQLPLQQTAV